MKTGRRNDAVRSLATFGVAAAAVLGVLAWSRRLDTWILIVSAIATLAVLAMMWKWRDRSPWLMLAIAMALAAHGAAMLAVRDFRRIEFDWPAVEAERRERLETSLAELMSSLAERGRQAAQLAADVAAEPSLDNVQLFRRLEQIRARTGVDALAIFGAGGGLVAWSGDHRGKVPDEVRHGDGVAHFGERPLYSYLYFADTADSLARQAVAAVLVETGAFPRVGTPGLTTTLAGRTNVPAIFRSGADPGGASAWNLTAGPDTVVHARLESFTQAGVRELREISARRAVVVAAFVSLFMLVAAWLRRGPVHAASLASAAPLLIVAVAVAIAPLGQVLALEGRASSLAFLIPVPGMSLGDIVAILLAAAALVATMRRVRISPRRWPAALVFIAALLGVAWAVTLSGFVAVARPTLLDASAGLWFGIQLAAVLVLTLMTALVLPVRRRGPVRGGGVRWPVVVFALTVTAGLSVAVQAWAFERHSPAPALAVFWALPILLLGFGTATMRSAAQRLGRWIAISVVAATAVLPQLWGLHTEMRLRSAQLALGTFGIETPPIVEYLMESFWREVLARHAAGEAGPQLLYRSWVASGLAQEPYPMRISLWEAGAPDLELRLGGAEGSDSESDPIREFVHEGATLDVPRIGGISGLPNANLLLTIPLDSTRTVSVTVEPRRSLQREGIISPFLGSVNDTDAEVTLVPQVGPAPPVGEIAWVRSPDGWRSEAEVRFPDGPMHAHLVVHFTDPLMRVARGTLLVTFDAGLLILLWVVGHIARGMRVVREDALRGWSRTYRARVTVALFVFFLVPTAVFGWLAYGGMSAVVTEAAGTVAERAAREAVLEWPRAEGDLRELAVRTGYDVLYYLGGELIDSSSPEGLALGAYGAWMGPVAYSALEDGHEATAREIDRLEGLSYLTAYEVLRPSGTLAVPVALSVGDIVSRQRDIAHLTLLAAVLGLLLSGTLSVLVGRALTGPIGQLRRAAAAVGGGNLGVRLPEPAGGEFGQVFTSFNRMVRRLRRARAQEVRTARILAWGEMAQQIAHEIKNPLTPIKLAVQHLRRSYQDGRSDFRTILDDNVDQILIEIDRLTEISRAFSRYGAPPEEVGPLRRVDVGKVVREAITLYRAGDPGVRYGVELDDTLPEAWSRTEELREVLMNLLENARDAVADDGAVTVAAHASNGRVVLSVHDDGAGIPADLVPRIFDPHFSTRSTGTGLGLAIVRRLVEGWGGSVDVDSRPGRGTTFRVHIPVTAGTASDGDGTETATGAGS
ncbi:MAG TPA: ATP-binding protein [Longimicrobiales bacterium]|nr:ATP-binding protein [Longimicrobiales bacterium]